MAPDNTNTVVSHTLGESSVIRKSSRRRSQRGSGLFMGRWARGDSNSRPSAYETGALHY